MFSSFDHCKAWRFQERKLIKMLIKDTGLRLPQVQGEVGEVSAGNIGSARRFENKGSGDKAHERQSRNNLSFLWSLHKSCL